MKKRWCFVFHKWQRLKNLDEAKALGFDHIMWKFYRICGRCGAYKYVGPCGTAAG